MFVRNWLNYDNKQNKNKEINFFVPKLTKMLNKNVQIDNSNLLMNAMILFMQKGPHSITLDEIAQRSGISKKTIYKSYTDKTAFVDDVYKQIIGYTEKRLLNINDKGENAVAEYKNICKAIMALNKHFNPNVISELKRFYYSTYREFKVFRNLFLPTILSYNIERGIRENIYNSNINSDVFAAHTVYQLEYINKMPTALLQDNSKRHIKQQLVKYILYSLTTAEGKKLVDSVTTTTNNLTYNN